MKPTACLAIRVLAVVALTAGRPAAAASATCDRECLRGMMTTFLYALLEHDAGKVPIAGTVGVTRGRCRGRPSRPSIRISGLRVAPNGWALGEVTSGPAATRHAIDPISVRRAD